MSSFPTSVFPVWKRVRLETRNGFLADFAQAGVRVGGCMKSVLEEHKPLVFGAEQGVDLSVVDLSQLGFKEGVNLADITKVADGFGLGLCSVAIGPCLRLQYTDQPDDESVKMIVKPSFESTPIELLFHVFRERDVLWIVGCRTCPRRLWLPTDRFVFVRHQQEPEAV